MSQYVSCTSSLEVEPIILYFATKPPKSVLLCTSCRTQLGIELALICASCKGFLPGQAVWYNDVYYTCSGTR